jgi:hypothetical protein
MIPSRVLIPRITRTLIPATMLCLCAAGTLGASPVGQGALTPRPRTELMAFVPPPVQITCPTPPEDTILLCPPNVQISWDRAEHGHGFPRPPFQYKFILLGPGSEFPVSAAVNNPESLRDYYADHPLGPWAGWDSTDAHTRQVRYTNLIPSERYLFAVIALDRDGDYSPVFDLTHNLLHFIVGYPANSDEWSPVLSMSGPGFHYTYPHGGFCPCESTEIPAQIRDHQRATFRWSAEPGFLCGSLRIRWYRWALDIADVFDETPRIDEETDLQHWSQRSPDATAATLGPFAPGEVHRLYIEASDDIGLISLGIIRIEVGPGGAGRRQIELAVAPRPGGADVSYSLPEPGNVEIAVYDVAGRRVATLEDAAQTAGKHTLTWDASGVGQGMYFYRLRVGPAFVTRRVLLLR